MEINQENSELNVVTTIVEETLPDDSSLNKYFEEKAKHDKWRQEDEERMKNKKQKNIEKMLGNDPDDPLDFLNFIFTVKKISDFADNLCECDDPINGPYCKFCQFLSNPNQREYMPHSKAYGEYTDNFFNKLVQYFS